MKRLRKFLALHARLLFAWRHADRVHVKRSVGQRYRNRPKPKAVA